MLHDAVTCVTQLLSIVPPNVYTHTQHTQSSFAAMQCHFSHHMHCLHTGDQSVLVISIQSQYERFLATDTHKRCLQ